ncbi:unnamed protein product [Amoebophrya sp. A120]|nr:unnamed protein product [Amoebophrya sp. A120]|eukprot:GSA120T00015258001.1
MTSKLGRRRRSSVGPALLALATEWSALSRVLLSSGEQDEAARGATILAVSGYVWTDAIKKRAAGALVSQSQREVRRRNFAGGRGALRHDQPGKSAFLGEVSKTRGHTTAVATGIGRRGLHAGADHESHVADLCDAHFGSGFLERYKHNSVVLCGHFSSGRNATAWLQCSGPHLNVTGNKIETLGKGAYCWGKNLSFFQVAKTPAPDDWDWALDADCEWKVDESSDLVLVNRYARGGDGDDKKAVVRIPKKTEELPSAGARSAGKEISDGPRVVEENLFVLSYFEDVWNPNQGLPQAFSVHFTQLLAREQLAQEGKQEDEHTSQHPALPEGNLLVLQKHFKSRSEGVCKVPYLYRQMLGGRYIRDDTPQEHQTGQAGGDRRVETEQQGPSQKRFTGKNVFFVVGSEPEDTFGLDCKYMRPKYTDLDQCRIGDPDVDAQAQKQGEFARFSSCRGRAPLIESTRQRILNVFEHPAEGGSAHAQAGPHEKCTVLFYNRHDHRRRATNHEEARQALQAEENALALDGGQRATSPRGLDACTVKNFDPDVLSMEEQMEAFADARLMIGPHGATFGLGAVLMKPGNCSVSVEIFTAEHKGAHNIALLRNVTHINYVPSWGPAWGDWEFKYNVPELRSEYKKWRGMVRSCQNLEVGTTPK